MIDANAAANALGQFLGTLHRLEAPADGPTNEHRGVPPRMNSKPLIERIDRLRNEIDHHWLEREWLDLITTPDWSGTPNWCHGDLHPFNMLVAERHLAAIIDWGDMHIGEPAPDLASAWLLLPASEHATFREAYGDIDDATWRRGSAWALYFGVMFVHAGNHGAGAGASRLGHATLENLRT